MGTNKVHSLFLSRVLKSKEAVNSPLSSASGSFHLANFSAPGSCDRVRKSPCYSLIGQSE